MKKLVFPLFLLFILGLTANPIDPTYIRQIWFNENSELIVQFGPHASYLASSEDGVTFSDGTNSEVFILTETNHENYPLEYNLAEIAPHLTFDPENGYFSMSQDYVLEELHWGNNPYICDVTPLIGSQTYYQYMELDIDEWGYTIIYKHWAKSNCADDVQDTGCETGSYLNISLRNLQNEPLSGFPMYFDNLNWPYAYSDEEGMINCWIRSRRTVLSIYAPGGSESLYSKMFMAEPSEIYDYDAIIDYTGIDDPTVPVAEVKLSLKPSVIHAGKTLQVDCSDGFGGSATLKLYDIKGRQLDQYQYTGAMQVHTQKLPAGIYFLRLQNGSNILDTQRFIVLK